MHPAAIDALVARIREFFALAAEEQQRPAHERSRVTRTFGYEGRGIELTPQLEAQFEVMVSAFLKERSIANDTPRDTVAQRLMNALLASRTTDSLEDLVKKVADDLHRDITSFRVYIPVSGVVLESGKTIEFGDIRMVTYDDSSAFDTEFRRPFLALQAPGATDATIRRNEAEYMEYLSALTWRPILVFKVHTSLANIRHVVFERVQPIADFWQFCLSTIVTGAWTPSVDYHVSAITRGMQVFPCIAEDGSVMSFPVLPGGAPAVPITDDRLAWLAKLGLLDLCDLFGTSDGDQGDGIKALIRRSIENYADGERATSPRQKLLSFAAASELFFTRRLDTTAAVTHGIARLLSEADASKDFDRLRANAEQMYNARSRVIHDGVAPRSVEVGMYSASAQRVILEMIKRRADFEDKAAIEAWSAPPPPRASVVTAEEAGDR